MGIVGLGEAVFEEDDKREAGFAERAGDSLLAFGDSGGDIDSAVGSFGEALVAEGGDVGGCEAAGALEYRPLRVVGEEDIAERGARDTADEGLAMEAEKVGISALKREAAGVVEDVVLHVGELAFVGQHAVMILGGKEDVSRGDIREHWTGGSISRRDIAEHLTGGCEGVIMVGALEFEPANIGTEVLGQAVVDLYEDMHVIGHHYERIDLDGGGIAVSRNPLDLCGDLLAERRETDSFSH